MKLPLPAVTIALLLLSAAGQSGAVGRLAELTVHDRDSGERLKTYFYRGQNYVVGTPGNRYAVSVRNTGGERVMAVVSVDGVNVVSGETAAPDQTGYVLAPHAATEINGWRKSMNEVAAFVFSNEENSYAARTGRPDNVGVIGVAVFREKVQRQRWREGRMTPDGAAPSAAAPPRDGDQNAAEKRLDSVRSSESGQASGADAMEPSRLGTAHGEREESRVGYTEFTRARPTPDEVITIRYDSYRNLVAMGVIPHRRPVRQVYPNPFPGRFVPDPVPGVAGPS